MNDHASQSMACSLAFLAGAVAGATVGVLLAPSSGRETRERINRGVRESAEKARQVKDRVVRSGEATLAAAARKTREAAEAVSTKLGGERPLGNGLRAAEELS